MLRIVKAKLNTIVILLLVSVYVITSVYFSLFALKNPFVGIDVQEDASGYQIISVLPNGLGENLKLRPGDLVISIDGKPVGEHHTVARWGFIEQATQLSVQSNGVFRVIDLTDEETSFDMYNVIISIFLSLIFIWASLYTYIKSRYRKARIVYFLFNYVIALGIMASLTSNIGHTPAYLFLYIALCIVPALLLTLLRYFPHMYISKAFTELNKVLYGGAITLSAAYVLDYVLQAGLHSSLRRIMILWFTFGIIVSFILLVLRYYKQSSLELKNQFNILMVGISLSVLPVLLVHILPTMVSDYNHVLPYRYTLLPFVLIPITFSYILVKKRLVDFNIHFPKILGTLGLALGGVLGYLAWSTVVSSGSEGSVSTTLQATGVLLIICGVMVGQRVLLPFLNRVVLGSERSLKQHKYELLSRLLKNEQIDSILSFLIHSVNQTVAVRGTCIVVYREPEQENVYLKATGQLHNVEQALLKLGPEPKEEELEQLHIEFLLPLVHGEKRYGQLYLGEKINGSRFEKEEQEKLRDLLEYGASIISNALLIEQMDKDRVNLFLDKQKAQQQVSALKLYTGSLLEAQQEERKALSHYLHDEILQNVISVHYMLDTSIQSIYKGQFVCKKESIAEAISLTDEIIKEIREKCFDLYPVMIDDIGFIETCEYIFTHEKLYTGGVRLNWDCRLTEQEMNCFTHAEKKVIFRAIKELVINAIKHANGTRVAIQFTSQVNGEFSFSVSDNGQGFSTAYLQQYEAYFGDKHIGLISVKQMIEGIGGYIDIFSSKEKGTNISIHFRKKIEGELNIEAYPSVNSR